jgi:hypothetical protein
MKLSDEFLEAARKLAEGEARYCNESDAFTSYEAMLKFAEMINSFTFDFDDDNLVEGQRQRILACLFAHHFYRDLGK